jgi:hypothetical protein
MPLLFVHPTSLDHPFRYRFSTRLAHAGSSVQLPSLWKSLLPIANVALVSIQCYSSSEVFFPFCVFVLQKGYLILSFFQMKVVRALVVWQMEALNVTGRQDKSVVALIERNNLLMEKRKPVFSCQKAVQHLLRSLRKREG